MSKFKVGDVVCLETSEPMTVVAIRILYTLNYFIDTEFQEDIQAEEELRLISPEELERILNVHKKSGGFSKDPATRSGSKEEVSGTE